MRPDRVQIVRPLLQIFNQSPIRGIFYIYYLVIIILID